MISSTPGSSSAAATPSGPASRVTWAPDAATARTAGPASSTSPFESSRAISTRCPISGRPPAAARRPRAGSAPSRGRSRSPEAASGMSARGSVSARPCGGIDVGTDVADHGAAVRRHLERGRSPQHQARLRLPAGARVARQMGADEEPLQRTEQLVDAPVDRSHLLERDQAAADAALVRDDGEPDAGRAQSVERCPCRRHRDHAIRIAVVRHVVDQGVVAIEQRREGVAGQRAWAAMCHGVVASNIGCENRFRSHARSGGFEAARAGDRRPMRVLGINAVFHDPAAALVVDGRVVAAPRRSGSAAASTARRRCRSRPGSCPSRRRAGAWHRPVSTPGEVDAVAYSYDPALALPAERRRDDARLGAACARSSPSARRASCRRCCRASSRPLASCRTTSRTPRRRTSPRRRRLQP